MQAAHTIETEPQAPVGRRYLTIVLMVLGYAGYYLCRSDLSIAMPLLIEDLKSHGLSAGSARIGMGLVASWGVFAYAGGKILSGWFADIWGGKRNFVTGMAGSVLFTILFAVGGALPVFTMAWIGNRFIQSFGWSGMVKIVSKWWPFSSYGSVMGIISLSYLFGDALARQFLSLLIARGAGWQELFLAAAAVLAVLTLANVVLLKESPRALGFSEPPVNPGNLFRETDGQDAGAPLFAMLRVFARSRAFWLVCLLSLGVTLIRETFNLWTPEYFVQALGFTAAEAAQRSSWFPLAGGFSALLAGALSDRLGRNGRALIVLFGLLLASVVLAVLAYSDPRIARGGSVLLVTAIAFLIIGPYSFLGGAMALDFGGRQGSATASGLIDGIGYLAGVLAGSSIAAVSVKWGWTGAFGLLSAVAALSSVVAAIYLMRDNLWRGTR